MATWRACAGLGVFLGTLTLITLMHTQGQAAFGGIVVVASLLTFRVVFVISRRLFGHVRLVLLEYLLITLAVTALVLAAMSTPVLAGLDAWILAMVLVLAVGRVGCLMAGCCHGRVAARGVAYPWLRWAGAPRCLEHVTLMPVQGYESALLALIFAVGLLLFTLPHRPGDILVFFLGAYGAGRFGLEFLRGDSRPYLRGFSEAQWICLALILSIATLWIAGVGDRSYLWLIWSGLLLSVVACTTLIAGRYFGPPLLRPLNKYDLDDFVETVRRVRLAALHARSNLGADAGAEGQTRRGLRVAVWLASTCDGQPVEQYRFSGPHGRLDGGTLAFAMCLARESIGRGGNDG
jgi:prolipoprotein diacylglyceryltransferase